MSGSLNIDNAGILQYQGSNGSTMNVISPNSTGSLPIMNSTAPLINGSATVDIVLTVAQSGSIILMPQATADVIVSLPPIAGSAGVKYRIVFQSVCDGTHPQAIQVGTGAGVANSLAGCLLNVAAAGFTSAVIPNTGIARGPTAADTKAGDYVDCFCDGTVWQCNGVGVGAAATYIIS